MSDQNRQKTVLVLACVFVLTLVPVVEVDAWWKGVGEMSGPGPFFGLDLIFPWSFANAELNLLSATTNQHLLNDIMPSDNPIPPLSLSLLDFLENEAHAKFYGVALDIEVLKTWEADQDELGLIDTFLSIDSPLARSQMALPRDPTAVATLSRDERMRMAQVLFQILDTKVWQEKSDELRKKVRTYGRGWGGFFGSQQALPDLADPLRGKNAFNNWFFTLATGYAFSLRNNLDYRPANEASTRVHWLTIYPAFEYRFGIKQPDPQKAYVKSNWFWNFGPTFHYFFGEAFDNFTRVSARTRAGWRYKGIYFGGELDYFIPVVQHSEFGALPDGELARFSYGAFIGFELRRSIGHKRSSAGKDR